MTRIRPLIAVAALACAAGFAAASGVPEPKTSVALAKTWETAVAEAKALNVPLVVHSHGMFCGPCWGMHDSVMCNKKYIDFANENTVEVISLGSLQEGIDKKDRRAETYDAKVGGKTVKYMVEFPGLTTADVLGLASSKAASFNGTGKIPYTCIVDPYTESEIKNWQGATSAGTIMDAITEAKKALQKDHGKGVARKDLRAVSDVEADAEARTDKGDFSGALDSFAKVAAKADKWPDSLKDRVKADREKVVAAAQAALDKIADTKAADPAQAKKDLTALASRLKGTGLEDKARELLASL